MPAHYHHYHQQPQAQPYHRGPFQILPLPAEGDLACEKGEKKQTRRQVSRSKASHVAREHSDLARPQVNYSPAPATSPSLPPNSPELLIRNISLRSTGSRELAKSHKPSYWRQDYLPPSSPWIKKRFLELRSLVTGTTIHLVRVANAYTAVPDDVPTFATSNFHRALRLNPLLRCPSPAPPFFYFDLRQNPLTTPAIHLPTSNGPVADLHHLQLATTPSVHQLHLWHPCLPWTLLVRSSNPSGILVSDILRGMHEELMTPIGSHDWYNAEMTAEDRERIEETYKIRCGGDIEALMGGIRRMDWLGPNVGFLGLVKSWNGMWEIKTVDVVALCK